MAETGLELGQVFESCRGPHHDLSGQLDLMSVLMLPRLKGTAGRGSALRNEPTAGSPSAAASGWWEESEMMRFLLVALIEIVFLAIGIWTLVD